MCTHSTTSHGELPASSNKRAPDGGHTLKPSASTWRNGNHWQGKWIASQQALFAKILVAQEHARDLAGDIPGQHTPECSKQLTLGALLGSSWKTPPKFGPVGALSSPATWWRVDTAGETEPLPRLSVEPHTLEIDGSCSPKGPTLLAGDAKNSGMGQKRQGGKSLSDWCKNMLPTLTNTGNYNRKGITRKAGDGIATALARLLPNTAELTDGMRLTPMFAVWWMGWPTAVLSSLALVTHGFRSKPPPPGPCSADQ